GHQQLFFILRGRGEYLLDGRRYHYTDGDLFIAGRNRTHALYPARRSVTRTLEAKFIVHERTIVRGIETAKGYFPGMSAAAIGALEAICTEGDQRHEHYREIAEHTLAALLFRLVRGGGEGPPSEQMDIAFDPIVQNTLDHMQKNLAEKLSLADVSQAAGCSARHLSGHFKRVTGRTVFDELKHLRVARAKEIIAASTATLEHIAAETGFENVQHFNRVFRELSGTTPGAWRKRERDGVRKDITFGRASMRSILKDSMKPNAAP
ncbi:MAG: AraC family transcriptional regulator, partial [Spirochaetota bacterium]